jgi:signal transduction histidine kinase
MSTDEELFAALGGDDEQRVRDAVRACAKRTENVDDQHLDPSVIAERLLPLVTHKSGKVRQSLADACFFFPPLLLDRALGPLLEDGDGYVKRAAERTAERRAKRRKTREAEDETEAQVAAILEKIGAKSKESRRLAERAIAREREYFARKLHHELVKIVTPLKYSLMKLKSEIDKPVLDRHALAKNADAARVRLDFLWAVVDSAREYTATVTPEFCDEGVSDMVDEARGHLLDRLGEKRARVVFENEVPHRMRVQAHRPSLLQALQNVLQNGAEAYDMDDRADPTAPIRLTVTAKPLRGGSQVMISIRDYGVGMTDEQKAHLFVPFGSWKPGGTGVGLVIARKMVESVHSGFMEIESKVGEGTTVHMTLPAKQTGASSS